MSIRLILSDLDDTLLAPDLTISPANRGAVEAAMARGIRFVAASGRMRLSIQRALAPTGWRVPIVSCNGARAVFEDGASAYERLIPLALAREILALARDRGRYVQTYDGDDYMYARECELSLDYARGTGVPGKEVGDLLEHTAGDVDKILFIGPPSDMAALRDELAERYRGKLSVVQSKPVFVEITHPEATKGCAARALADAFGIAREDVLALGDGDNDAAMIEYAGVGVAMGDASAKLRALADWVAPPHDEDGVARAIERFALSGGHAL